MPSPDLDSPSLEPPRWRVKWPYLAIVVVALVTDLWSKHWVFAQDPGLAGVVAEPTGWFRIIQTYNRGITFGLLSGSSAWLLAAGTGVVIAILGWQLWQARRDERVKAFALAIVIGGAIGNLYDRAFRNPASSAERGVRDFLDWYVPKGTAAGDWLIEQFGTNHWYTSNVADVLIVSGVILLAGCILTERPEAEASKAPGDADADADRGAEVGA